MFNRLDPASNFLFIVEVILSECPAQVFFFVEDDKVSDHQNENRNKQEGPGIAFKAGNAGVKGQQTQVHWISGD